MDVKLLVFSLIYARTVLSCVPPVVSTEYNFQQNVTQISGSLGSFIRVQCVAEPDTVVTSYAWQKNGENVEGPSTFPLFLSIRSLAVEDGGQYRCEVMTANCGTRYSPEISINTPPDNAIIAGPSSVAERQGFQLRCSANGWPPPSYEWSFNRSSVGTGSVYSVVSATLSDTGEYTCLARNSRGQITETVNLYVTGVEQVMSTIPSPVLPPTTSTIVGTTTAPGTATTVNQAPGTATTVDRYAVILNQKCVKYWPASDDVDTETVWIDGIVNSNGREPLSEVGNGQAVLRAIYGNMVVRNNYEEVTDSHTTSYLSLYPQPPDGEETGDERDVYHFWYTAWSDFSVPKETGSILKLREAVDACRIPTSGPVVVHCSAGLGRSGTFMAIDMGIQQYEKEGIVDPLKYMCEMRQDRGGIIQTPDQYIYIHRTLKDYMTSQH